MTRFTMCGPPKNCTCPAVAYRCQCEASQTNYTGPEPSVECARKGCTNRLRKVENPLFANDRQWCSHAHRDWDEFDDEQARLVTDGDSHASDTTTSGHSEPGQS